MKKKFDGEHAGKPFAKTVLSPLKKRLLTNRETFVVEMGNVYRRTGKRLSRKWETFIDKLGNVYRQKQIGYLVWLVWAPFHIKSNL